MRYCPNFISRAEEQELDKLLEAGPWQFLADARLRHIKSRAQQFFGLVYYQTSHELPALQPNHPASQREARPLQELPEWLMQRIVATGAFPREGLGDSLQFAWLLLPEQEIRSDGADHGNWVKILLEPRHTAMWCCVKKNPGTLAAESAAPQLQRLKVEAPAFFMPKSPEVHL
ncbi:unnamed protein product [Effrenium voratum]|uniref:Uncharacterized protein n=1 Tax=Effrenium voratum TaxID=2562239 RepID=A0AA36HUN3_9DINO|nr:unnamed protein product [Effrenium voratum]